MWRYIRRQFRLAACHLHNLGSSRALAKGNWRATGPSRRDLLWPVSGEALLSTSFVERSCRNDQGFGFEGNSWMLLTCLWRIAISLIIPEDFRPAAVLRSAIWSFFSSTSTLVRLLPASRASGRKL